MIFDYQSGVSITKQYFPQNWAIINNLLVPRQFNNVITGITTLMIGANKEYTVPGFEAKDTWTGLPWDILYQKTNDWDLARKLMGLMAMHAFKVHPAHWFTNSTTYSGRDVPNRYYTQMRIGTIYRVTVQGQPPRDFYNLKESQEYAQRMRKQKLKVIFQALEPVPA